MPVKEQPRSSHLWFIRRELTSEVFVLSSAIGWPVFWVGPSTPDSYAAPIAPVRLHLSVDYLAISSPVRLPVRPVPELKDFARLALAAGETRTFTLDLTPDKLEGDNLAMHCTVLPGAFEILVGESSVKVMKTTLIGE